MKKIIIKRCIGIISVILAVILCLGFLQRYFLSDVSDNTMRLRGFYLEDKDSLDVVVLGASEVYSDFNADEFYKKTGITSYPYAFAANPITLWKYELREILAVQHPKVLIVEMNSLRYGEDMLYKPVSFRYLTQSMKLGPEKKEIIDNYADESKLSYYFPIMKYHSEWHSGKNIKNGLYMLKMDLRGHALLKGAFTHTAPEEIPEELRDYDAAATRELHPDTEQYLLDFLEECKGSGIEHILFVRFPHLITSKKDLDALKRYNRAGEIVEQYGYEYVNMDDYCEEAGIDRPGDFHNMDHLMMDGQMKFTDFLADYLTDKYDLSPSRLTEEQKKDWDESVRWMDACFAYYHDYMKDPVYDNDYSVYERSETMKLIREYLGKITQ